MKSESKIFVSFFVTMHDSGSGFGNQEIIIQRGKISSIDDIFKFQNSIIKNNKDIKDIQIISWQRFEE